MFNTRGCQVASIIYVRRVGTSLLRDRFLLFSQPYASTLQTCKSRGVLLNRRFVVIKLHCVVWMTMGFDEYSLRGISKEIDLYYIYI